MLTMLLPCLPKVRTLILSCGGLAKFLMDSHPE